MIDEAMRADPMQSVIAPKLQRRSDIFAQIASLHEELARIERDIAAWYALPDPPASAIEALRAAGK